jgi:hypothetical protein
MILHSPKANWIEVNPALLWLKHRILRILHFIDFCFRRDKNEILMASTSNNPFEDCPDWHELEKVTNAGRVRGGYLVMHNGIKVLPTAYQGYGHGKLMQRALGVHEPQEERLFRDVILQLPANSVMVELGSYWAYYSLWFQSCVSNARSIMVEPKLSHLNYGKRHFKINSFKGDFLQAGVGKHSVNNEQLRIATVDELFEVFSLEKLSILHSDIQGYELEMLQGAEKALKEQAIDFFFISTHSDSLHEDCLSRLKNANYQILDSYRISKSWNPDGLIVAQSSAIPTITLKSAARKSE